GCSSPMNLMIVAHGARESRKQTACEVYRQNRSPPQSIFLFCASFSWSLVSAFFRIQAVTSAIKSRVTLSQHKVCLASLHDFHCFCSFGVPSWSKTFFTASLLTTQSSRATATNVGTLISAAAAGQSTCIAKILPRYVNSGTVRYANLSFCRA